MNGTESFINGTEFFTNGTESFRNGTELFINSSFFKNGTELYTVSEGNTKVKFMMVTVLSLIGHTVSLSQPVSLFTVSAL